MAGGGAGLRLVGQAAGEFAGKDPEGHIDAGHLTHRALAEKVPREELFASVKTVDGVRKVLCLDPEGDHAVRPELAADLLGEDDIVAAVGAG